MEILVITGSPKGQDSVTFQHIKYLEIRYPMHHFAVLHAGKNIRALEKDFSPALATMEKAELVLFVYPVYTFLAPSQLQHFIALMKANKAPVAGKYMSQITTSKHFYDVTAHSYVQQNCQDMGMKAVRGLSADMEDLLSPKGRQEAVSFFEDLLWQMGQGFSEPAIPSLPFTPIPATLPETASEAKPGDVVIVADIDPADAVLQTMVDRFQRKLNRKSRVVNLREFPFQGGCLGCFHCATDGQCVYKDGFDRFLREEIQTAEAILYAYTITDHSQGWRFKLYNDRQFCNGHRTVTMGTPMGYLINGPYSREFNLQMVVEGRCQVGGNFLCGVATSEGDTDRRIDMLAATVERAITAKSQRPQNFWGVGGMKIFRDLIWQMQGMMKADHRFFKAHGQYDFPQKHRLTMMKMYLVGAMIANPSLRKKLGNKLNEGMLMPYEKVLKEVREGKL